MDALLLHRIHFAFTITYHYLLPQLTMGLALLIVVLKTIAIRRKDERYNEAARFWARIFEINFLIGVVTGIPMEFQLGTPHVPGEVFTGGRRLRALSNGLSVYPCLLRFGRGD